jgi:O6-methylguanine-DNA--protein-cysteine methyltransferase
MNKIRGSEKGGCAISLGDDPESLARDLQDQFPRAELVGGDQEFEKLVAYVVGFIEAPRTRFDLRLDVRGTAFQLLGRPVDLLPEPVEKHRLQDQINRDRRRAF